MSLTSLVTILQPFGGTTAAPSPPQTFRKALRAKLLSLDDLTAIVGSNVYPGELPMGYDLSVKGPAVTYIVQKLRRGFTGTTGHTLSGSDGTVLVRAILTAWSYSFADVDRIATILFVQLDGIFNASDWGDGSIVIMECLHGPELDMPEQPTTGRKSLTYRIESEYEIRYRANPMPVHS